MGKIEELILYAIMNWVKKAEKNCPDDLFGLVKRTEKEIIELIKRGVIPEKPSGDYSNEDVNRIIDKCLYNLEKLKED